MTEDWKAVTIRADMIPNEVVEAAARATWEDWRAGGRQKAPAFEELQPWVQDDERKHARAAIAAALNAWPDMAEQFFPNSPLRPPGIFLPLPQEGK